jgi:hypothetical protein
VVVVIVLIGIGSSAGDRNVTVPTVEDRHVGTEASASDEQRADENSGQNPGDSARATVQPTNSWSTEVSSATSADWPRIIDSAKARTASLRPASRTYSAM